MITGVGLDEDTFVIAVKRERREVVSADWINVIRGMAGVTVLGDANPSRVQVRASADAIARIRDQFADDLYVERLILHRKS